MTDHLAGMRQMRNLRAQLPVRSPAAPPVIRTQATAPAPRVSRSWRAGEWSDLTGDWSITPQWAYTLTANHLSTLRSRARSELRTNDFAKRFVGMLKSGVVGPNGFQLQACFEDPRGRDKVASKAFEAHWKKWASDPKACDVRERSTLQELCNQWMGGLATDGEIFVRWRRRGPMGFQLQTIEPLTIDHTYHESLRNGNVVRFGIEINPEFGNAVAFYQNKGTPRDHPYPYPTGERERIDASEIWHLFITEAIDQLRGFPWLSTPMYRMHMLDGFEESALVNARASAAKLGIKTQRDPERYAGEGGAGAGVEEVYPGMYVEHLNEHETWSSHDPTYPTGDFSDYVKQMLRGVASGLEVSYPTLANDLAGVNYTSLRHDALTERDVYVRLQGWLADHLLTPMYRRWLMIRLVEGVPIPRVGGGSRPASIANREKYENVKWIGRRWQWVDPAKEMDAAEKGVANAFTTRSQVIRDQGRDPEEVFEEWERENERFGAIQKSQQPRADDRPDD